MQRIRKILNRIVIPLSHQTINDRLIIDSSTKHSQKQPYEFSKENTLSTRFSISHRFSRRNAVRHHPYFRKWRLEWRKPDFPACHHWYVCLYRHGFLPHPLERLWTCHHQQHFRCCHSYHYSIDYRCFERHMDDKWGGTYPYILWYADYPSEFFPCFYLHYLCIGISNDGKFMDHYRHHRYRPFGHR